MVTTCASRPAALTVLVALALLLRHAAASNVSCDGLDAVTVTDTSVPLALAPGKSYQLGPGTFTLAATAAVAETEVLCVAGTSAAATTLLPPAAGAPGHHIGLGGSVALRNLAIQGSGGRGGVLVTGGAPAPPHETVLEAANVVFSSNGLRAVTNLEDTQAELSFTDCSFVGNACAGPAADDPFSVGGCAVATVSGAWFGGARTELINNTCASGAGGAVWSQPLDGALRPSLEFAGGQLVVAGNSALRALGGAVFARGTDVSVSTTASTWTGNRARGRASSGVSGGALSLMDSPAVFKGRAAFSGNTGRGFGGAVAAIAITGTPNTTMLVFEGDVLFEGNQVPDGLGGAMYTSVVRFAARASFNCTGNSATNGGCLSAYGSTLGGTTAEFGGAVALGGNRASKGGGAIIVASTTMVFAGPVTAQDNQATDADTGQGGVISSFLSTVRFEGEATMADNNVGWAGGAIMFLGGSILVNAPLKLLNNKASEQGGAVAGIGGSIPGQTTQFTAKALVTVTGNTAVVGGAFMLRDASASFASSVWADNAALDGSVLGDYLIPGEGGAVLAFGGTWAFGSSPEHQTTFRNNTAATGGGALSARGVTTWSDKGAAIKFTGGLCVQGNAAVKADAGGGGLLVGPASTITFAGGAAAAARQNFGINTAGGAESDIQLEDKGRILCGSDPRTDDGTYLIEGPVCGPRCGGNGKRCSCPPRQPFSPTSCSCQATLTIESFTASPSDVVLGNSTKVRVELGASGAGASVTVAVMPNKARCSPNPATANRKGVAEITCFFTAAGSFDLTAEARKGDLVASAALPAPVQVCSPIAPSGPYQQTCRGCSFSGCMTRTLSCSQCQCPCHGSGCQAGSAGRAATSSIGGGDSAVQSAGGGTKHGKLCWCGGVRDLSLDSCAAGAAVRFDPCSKALTCA